MRAEQVTIYRADDGSTWNSAKDAESRDAMVRVGKELESILSKKPPPNFSGWIQQNTGEVWKLKNALVLVAKRIRPNESWDDIRPDDIVHPGSYFSRLMTENGAEDPISAIWWRACCIDDHGREWEQWYFRNNPEEGLKRWPSPTA